MPIVKRVTRSRVIDPRIHDVEVDLTAWQALQKKMKSRPPGKAPPTYRMKPWPDPWREIIIRAKCDRCGKKGWLSVPEADRVLSHGSEVACPDCSKKC